MELVKAPSSWLELKVLEFDFDDLDGSQLDISVGQKQIQI